MQATLIAAEGQGFYDIVIGGLYEGTVSTNLVDGYVEQLKGNGCTVTVREEV